ncbi:MAG: hypothetical protein KDA79_02930 [Planctomycetaceae bacterium]|nr:hypothetical protein [Planctomycetaceae bacterium]
MGRVERDRELARRRTRKAKVKKLRAKYAAATDGGEKAEIAEKVRRMSPFVNLDEAAE